MKFQPGKKYIFSKAKWLAKTGNVWTYETYLPIREWVNKSDGQEVVSISADGMFGYVEKHAVTPESCDIAKSAFHEVFSTAVKRILHEDREDKLLERINMIEEEIGELEMRISILEEEQDNLMEELKFIQEQERQSEDIAWRNMKL
jgi:hypothetical protein